MASERITEYRKIMDENIFACMDLTKQQYTSILIMPINRFTNFIKWKEKLEEEKQKAMDDEMSKIKK